jgi:hypothetical protein
MAHIKKVIPTLKSNVEIKRKEKEDELQLYGDEIPGDNRGKSIMLHTTFQ